MTSDEVIDDCEDCEDCECYDADLMDYYVGRNVALETPISTIFGSVTSAHDDRMVLYDVQIVYNDETPSLKLVNAVVFLERITLIGEVPE